MVKDSVKKLKKSKKALLKAEALETSTTAGMNGESKATNKLNGDHDLDEVTEDVAPVAPQVGVGEKLDHKELKKRLLVENAYITDMLSLINFPKKAASDDEDEDDGVVMSAASKRKAAKALASGSKRAGNVMELEEKLKAKLADLRGDLDPGSKKGKKNKLTPEEKKQKKREAKRLKAKLAKANKQSLIKASNSSSTTAKPVYNAEGKMVFSKFDFMGGKNNKKSAKDPKAALQSIQKQKDKIKSLEAKGASDKVKAIEETTAWKNALDKTEGVKVKDDVTLLKKSIKKQEQRKKSSKKKWDERVSGVEKRKEAKQNKRSENISKRKQDKKQNKMKKLAKKGRIPGFR